MGIELHMHQKVALEKIINAFDEQKGFSLNDDMGLGKTITSVSVFKDLGCKKILILSPKAVIAHWEKEIDLVYGRGAYILLRYSGQGRAQKLNKTLNKKAEFPVIVISTVHTISSDIKGIWTKYDQVLSANKLVYEYCPIHYYLWDFMVVDESHVLRNPTSLIFQAACEIRRKKTLLLTGTPFNNTAADMATQCYMMKMPVPTVFMAGTYKNIKLSTIVESKYREWSIEDGVELDYSNSVLRCNKGLMSNFKYVEKIRDHYGEKGATLHAIVKDATVLVDIIEKTILYTRDKENFRSRMARPIAQIEGLGDDFGKKETVDTKIKSRVIHTFLTTLFDTAENELFPELLVNVKKNAIIALEKIFKRRLMIMQFRAFWEACALNNHVIDKVLIEHFSIRRRKTDLKEIMDKLPPMKIVMKEVYLDKETSDVHSFYVNKFLEAWTIFSREKFLSGEPPSQRLGGIMNILTRLRQCVNSVDLIHSNIVGEDTFREKLEKRYKEGQCGKNITETYKTSTVDIMARNIKYGPTSPKIEAILNYIDECLAKNEHVVVFSSWVTYLMFIREHLMSKKIGCMLIDGSQSLNVRNDIVDDFQQDGSSIKVLLASIKACCVGITLTKAQHAIFCESSWNPFGEELQAMQRIHRIGQEKETTVAFFVACRKGRKKVTMDHLVRMLQDNKMLSAQTVLGDSYLDIFQHSRIQKMPESDKGKLGRLAEYMTENML